MSQGCLEELLILYHLTVINIVIKLWSKPLYWQRVGKFEGGIALNTMGTTFNNITCK